MTIHSVKAVVLIGDSKQLPLTVISQNTCMLTALILIYLSSLSLSEQIGYRHRPTLVVCPPGVINTWLTEASRRFGDALPLYIFHRSAEHTGV
ncbi:hypothetical protein VTN00DRAFT_5996 [Thermoascus crustaceus]|uniref:uncharacterized protein n=1 Tax=Thermoascus crustaceus TaxID=5088 RepID=UPI003743C096